MQRSPGSRNLVALFLERAAEKEGRPFLRARRGGAWTSVSWSEARSLVGRFASALRRRGIGPGDRVVVASENRPEWFLADLGVLAAGAITVPAYVTGTVEDQRHVLNNSGARAAVVSNPALLSTFQEAAGRDSPLEFFVLMDPSRPEEGSPRRPEPAVLPVHSWDDLLSTAPGEAGGSVEGADEAAWETARALTRADLACIIHTSGTSGRPRGVMLSHGAILCNLEGAYPHFLDLGLEDEVFLSVLPISHAYEHTAGQFFALYLGAQIHYLENAAGFASALRQCRPTLMTTVPRLCEIVRDRIVREACARGGLHRRLLETAVELGRRRILGERPLSRRERLLDRLCERFVRARVRAHLGGRLKVWISGGAPLPEDLALFFNALGIRLLQGYGLTEAGPVVSCNPPLAPKHHTVGPPFAGVTVRIAPDGEILVRGELVMQGYWNDAEATRQALSGGWLYTGDVGALDEDGYLRITDRKKDIIKSSGGDRISPQRVEGALVAQPEIAQAVVFGEGRPQLVAVLVPEESLVREWAGARALPPELPRCAADPEFQKLIGRALERANRALAPPERVRRFILAREPFTPANGLLTPTLKARRHLVRDLYRSELDRL